MRTKFLCFYVIMFLNIIHTMAYDIFSYPYYYKKITSTTLKIVDSKFDSGAKLDIPPGFWKESVQYTVTSIGPKAFDSNTHKTDVYIPSTIKSIGASAFSKCTNIKTVRIEDITSWLEIEFEDSGSNPLRYADELYIGGQLVKSLVLPDGITKILNYSLSYFGLKDVTIPNTVTSIGNGAFYGCNSLSAIDIPNSVKSIGDYAFYNCSGLTSIEIPSSVTSIGKRAFEYCSGFTSVVIGNSVTSIGDYAFSDCDGLTSIEIPGCVTSIGDYAFYGCSNLTDVFILSSVPPVAEYFSFAKTPSNNTLHIPYGSLSAYKSTAIWNEFANYVEFNQPNNPTHQPVTLYMPDITGAISRWEYSRDGGASWTNIECEEYCYTETDPERGEVLYRVLKADGTYSNILTINYYDPVPETIATTPASETKTVDESITFTLNINDDGYAYQWKLNNVAIEGATNSTYTIPSIKMKDAGDYHCVVSNPVSCVNSTSSKLTINKCPQTITLPEFETKTYGDASFTLPATTDKGLTINYQSTNTSVATIDGNVVTIKEPGETNIIATQAGNDDYLEAAYVSRKLTVKKVSQTIVFNELQDKTFEDIPFTLPATTDRGLTISYQSTNTNVATIEGNTVTIVGAGTTDIIATQQGDEHHYAATPVSRTLTINRQVQTITFNAFGNVVYGDAQIELNQFTNKNFEIKYTSSNTDVATVNGNIITIVKPGVTVIKATQNGNKNYLPAQSIERTLIVNKAEQCIEWYELPAKNFGDENFVLPAITDKGLTINYTSDNENVATINGNIVSIKNAGTANITAIQSGDDYYNAATPVTHKLTVSKIAQTITFEELQAMTFGDAPIELYATTNSSSDVLFESSDETIATISGNILTIVGTGKCTITATCSGDNNYYTAIPIERELVVNKAKQTISISSVGAKTYGDDPFELEILTSNNQPVTISSSNASILSINGKKATIRGAGTVKITAIQEETANYEKSQTDIDVVINKAKLTASVSNAERVYGDANPNFKIAYSGFVNGETKEDLDAMPVAICSATESSNGIKQCW